jgi:membrane-associated protease RseP (regulator of RpoE activity)
MPTARVENALAELSIILISLLVAYVLFLVVLIRTGRMEKWNLSLMLGVVLMQRTQHGKRTIDFIARPKRFWNFVGDLGIVLTLSGMVAITVFFLWSVWLAVQPGSGVPALGLQEIFVIPGVNPFVPLWYGLAALAITLVVHEGGHGILARANEMKIKSLGLLWLVVPIGAFVEPEELDLKVASRRNRLRVFGAGPAVNIAFAAIALTCFALLMGSLVPKDGAWIAGVTQDALGNDMPAKKAGIVAGDILVDACVLGPGANDCLPQPLHDWAGLTQFLNGTRPGQTVRFGLEDGSTARVTLVSLWDTLGHADQYNVTAGTPAAMRFCAALVEPDPKTGSECAAALQARPRAGVSAISPERLSYLSDPFENSGIGFVRLTALPIQEVLSKEPVLGLYAPSFHTTPFHAPTFWVLANLAFWVFWINLMVGITNILPMLPLDGGHIFREAAGSVVGRLRPGLSSERRDRIVGVIATGMSFLILGAFIIQIAAPHLVR